MQIGNFLFAVLAFDVTRNVVHRPRTIKRHDSDQIFEAVGFYLLVHVLHPRRFKLEHAGSVAPLQKRIGFLVVKRHRAHVKLNSVVGLYQIHRPLDRGQGF